MGGSTLKGAKVAQAMSDRRNEQLKSLLCRLAELRGYWDDITAVIVEIVDFDEE